MNKLREAQAKVAELSRQVLDITEDTSKSAAEKVAALNKLDPEMKRWADEVESLRAVEARHKAWATAGVNIADLGSARPQVLARGPMVGAAPSLMPTEDQLRGLHEAVLSHKSYKIEVQTKTPTDDIPATLMPFMTGLSHEPTRILDLLPSTTMGTPSVEYLRHVSTTGTAGMVAPGGLKPAVTLVTDKLEARARKIAVTTKVNDEDLEDFSAFLGYVSAELQRLVIDEENVQLLTGDGTGENIEGIFTVTGILTRAKGAADEPAGANYADVLELAATDLRVGPAFTSPSVFAMHPKTWSIIRMAKDSQGRYLIGEPTSQDVSRLWGVPVVQSTGFTQGTVLAANLQEAAQAHVRKGLILQTDYGTDGFEHNTTTLRAEERIALAVSKPSAAVKVTGLV